MNAKKVIATCTATLLLSLSLSGGALAHHGSSNHAKKQTYAACSIKTCHQTATHKHNKKTYKGHALNDGHKHHKICTVKNCKKTAVHKHSGKTYFAHHKNDGHSYHKAKHH